MDTYWDSSYLNYTLPVPAHNLETTEVDVTPWRHTNIDMTSEHKEYKAFFFIQLLEVNCRLLSYDYNIGDCNRILLLHCIRYED